MTFQVLDNTINKVAEEVLSPEELEERQLKIQVIWNKNLQLLLLQLSFVLDLLINKFWWTEHIFLIAFLLFLTTLEQIVNNIFHLSGGEQWWIFTLPLCGPLISTTIHQHWGEYIFSETKKISLFLSIL